MAVESDLVELRARLQHLEDRAAILDCVARHARGCDRHDVELLSDAYHDDGVDEHGATRATVMCGRYLDRLERRDGTWRIALRRSTVEVAFTADAAVLRSKFFVAQGYVKGVRHRGDLAYDRPLSLTSDAERW